MVAGPSVREVSASDVEALAGVLARAFLDDPWLTYIFRAPPARREARMRRLYAKVLRHALACGRTVLTTETAAGVALWRAPGQYPDSAAENARQALPMLTVTGIGPTLLRAVRAERTAMSHHAPEPPHWYLEILASDPALQRSGHGTALVSAVLARADDEGLPAHLETQRHENVVYYRRFGFEVAGEADVPGGGPHLWFLERAPR